MILNAEQIRHLKVCEKKLSLNFKQKKMLNIAITHPSSSTYEKEHKYNFERLEFLGDSILNQIISEELFRLFPDVDEGFLSKMRSGLVSRKQLAKVGQKLSLKSMLIAGKGKKNDKIVCDAFESIIGALYLDRGRKGTKEFILFHLSSYMTTRFLNNTATNPKSKLQEYSQKLYKTLPQYEIKTTKTKVIATAYIKRIGRAKGEGQNKKEAQEKAARELLKKLKNKQK